MSLSAPAKVQESTLDRFITALNTAITGGKQPIAGTYVMDPSRSMFSCIVATGSPVGESVAFAALDGVTAGTGAASKAAILDSGEDFVWPATGVLTYGVLKDPAGTTLGATAAELNLAADVSAQTETLTADGAISVLKRYTKLADTGTGAYTLAAPDASMLGSVKVIEMTTDNGDVTVALTNVTGHTAETATFDDVGDNLVLVGGAAGKWIYVSATATLA